MGEEVPQEMMDIHRPSNEEFLGKFTTLTFCQRGVGFVCLSSVKMGRKCNMARSNGHHGVCM